MNKRVLMVATVPSMIGQFNINNIHLLLEMGYTVDVASDFTDTSVWPKERIGVFKQDMKNLGIECIQLDYSRNALKLSRHIASYKETLELLKDKKYSFIHTHTPIASAIIRLAAHKTGTKVIYTAHGFHFYKGAPFKNWIIFYPIEKLLSKYTDVLLTINPEDYKNALNKFQAKKTIYVPGVGVDTQKFTPRKSGREKIRKELGIDNDRLMLLSVGELNQNKNHESVIRAIQGFDITYVIVGKGELKESLEITAKECSVDIRLVGFRTDVADFYDAADVYVLPSIREGLNVSLMEAMASGLAVACGNIRGNIDLIENTDVLFSPTTISEITFALTNAIKQREILGLKNLEKIKTFSLETVNALMLELYKNIENQNESEVIK